MRLLKFNEGQFYTIENILYNFAVENLIYLLDEEFQIELNIDKRLSDSGRNNYYKFLFNYKYNIFYWEDIKDYFIPFLIRLKKIEYINIGPIGSASAGKNEIIIYSYYSQDSGLLSKDYFLVEDLINDPEKLEDLEINKIEFYIKQIN